VTGAEISAIAIEELILELARHPEISEWGELQH